MVWELVKRLPLDRGADKEKGFADQFLVLDVGRDENHVNGPFMIRCGPAYLHPLMYSKTSLGAF